MPVAHSTEPSDPYSTKLLSVWKIKYMPPYVSDCPAWRVNGAYVPVVLVGTIELVAVMVELLELLVSLIGDCFNKDTVADACSFNEVSVVAVKSVSGLVAIVAMFEELCTSAFLSVVEHVSTLMRCRVFGPTIPEPAVADASWATISCSV